MPSILLLTPPFTQLNTPYPATAYLKGFLNTLHIDSYQADLGIETTLQLFTAEGLKTVFETVDAYFDIDTLGTNLRRILRLEKHYIQTIEPVISFLQNKNPTLAHQICSRNYLPEAGRFDALDSIEWAFGTMGIQDKARHLATLYLEDLGDLIRETIDEHFGFSRYAERLSRTASDFTPIEAALLEENSLITDICCQLLEQLMEDTHAKVVCISVPFPGNLFAALKCGQHLKMYHPDVSVILGGGYVNTELRSLSDERIFDYVDYIALDDGEAPLKLLLEHILEKRPVEQLKRVFSRHGGVVCYHNNASEKDIPQREVGCPDYSDLLLQEYISVIEVANPMHRLWSDGRWNKLTLAHGCYWGKCSFCDVSLDYIQRYEPVSAAIICDRIEQIIEQTGENGFHFVDEAAPPMLLRDVSIEIIRRNLTVVWWTNIRFEKTFSSDLCRLMKAAGCIAVSGGLEVASDRLLKLMQKGVTVAQVAQVCQNFSEAGIMVHAYLMYGFPTQTAQETIDAMEMVRQLFELGVLHSAFWHQFAMTAHSPVGLNPEHYKVVEDGPDFMGFADNDRFHLDPEGTEHECFSEGLKTSLFNYMHGLGFDYEPHEWFDFECPPTSIATNYIQDQLDSPLSIKTSNIKLFWPNTVLELEQMNEQESLIYIDGPQTQQQLIVAKREATAIVQLWEILKEKDLVPWTALKDEIDELKWPDFEQLKKSYLWQELNKNGLLIL